ncbi:sn-glycerol-3-phosphate ABC transporter ATP-binding protein UgpC [Conexibacter sp. JD483]|uniref:ABC transporter ATP-binding protein n=1 Tax=unclassified Conexibacter TaxID=2627773 RepID=UPI00271E481C|nr:MULTISPECIES: sn-glycerol-3-phosphate ABC transporter ATP-binding protein UgpC [unclassified Conexibacter]MDO8187581.1 sn-glycerol-3-phosphate ABC transporter ATP-binding protein UgpC [Conexibacter sp. CPCC 205706]MDO8198947.1 sn-glycerol-3-phosphate ABC transporter ATP-binding protein UgpC [Conexibacter sp. CPCC 205762]MDR9370346.1 sn-glycerol-3-phosphate ABC transporter ATP-binding protein UgpC [Conexibacter sp. JD483]
MAEVAFEQVTKTFPDGSTAVDRLSLTTRDGELVVLVGPSGCGKSTTLRMLAGLETVSSGEIRLGERRLNDVEPQQRDIAMVFQSYALFPHLSVADNIAFGMRARRVAKQERARRVEEVAATLGLTPLLKRKPRALSGGQRQRVAMARAMVRDAALLLMDEPLSNLDAKLRVQMRMEVSRLQRQLAVTTLYVTHDQVEAMTLADRIAIMRDGVLQQFATPEELFERPANLFVASFIGSPAMNLFEVELVARANGGVAARVGAEEVVLGAEQARAVADRVGGRVALGVRPEDVAEAGARPGAPLLSGVVAGTEVLGSEVLVHVETGARPVATAEVEAAREADDGTPAPLAGSGATLIARLATRAAIGVGERAQLALDPERLYLFDLDGGGALATPVAERSRFGVAA